MYMACAKQWKEWGTIADGERGDTRQHQICAADDESAYWRVDV
jgi:hypothetical protein